MVVGSMLTVATTTMCMAVIIAIAARSPGSLSDLSKKCSDSYIRILISHLQILRRPINVLLGHEAADITTIPVERKSIVGAEGEEQAENIRKRAVTCSHLERSLAMTTKPIVSVTTLLGFLTMHACGTIPVYHGMYAQDNQSVIAGLNQQVAELKQLKESGKISEAEYYDKAWGFWESAAKKTNSTDFLELALYGRWQSSRYLSGEITKQEYDYLLATKNSELKHEAEAEMRQQHMAESQSTMNTLMSIFLLGTLLGPQSPIGPGPRTSSYCSGTVSGNVFSGNCQ